MQTDGGMVDDGTDVMKEGERFLHRMCRRALSEGKECTWG